jgi:hypothetical protein
VRPIARNRGGYGAKNMATVRRFVLCLVRSNKSKGSVQKGAENQQNGAQISSAKSYK